MEKHTIRTCKTTQFYTEHKKGAKKTPQNEPRTESSMGVIT
jgi:hypothetical protein